MATKVNLISNINSYLTAIITQAKHRLSMLEIINELFPSTTNYTLSTGDLQYNLNFTKSGNICVVSGFFKNNLNTIIDGIVLFNITNSVYYTKKTQYTSAFRLNGANNVTLAIGDLDVAYPNTIYLENSIPALETVKFSLTYITND